MSGSPAAPNDPPPTLALADIDLSRNKICVNDALLTDEGVVEMGKALALVPSMTALSLSSVGAETSAGVTFAAQI